MAFVSLTALAESAAFSAALAPIAGSAPAVINQGDHFDVTFTPDQEDKIAEWLRSQLNKEPGEVRMDLSGIALKVLARQYWPWIAGAVGLGVVVGYYGKGR